MELLITLFAASLPLLLGAILKYIHDIAEDARTARRAVLGPEERDDKSGLIGSVEDVRRASEKTAKRVDELEEKVTDLEPVETTDPGHGKERGWRNDR